MSTYEISNERIIGQQLKEICPQSDDRSERELPQIKRELKEIGPQADGVGEQQLTAIGQQLKKNNCAPWMICEPNEKEGRKLMAEIMQGGNFRQLFKWRMKNEKWRMKNGAARTKENL